MQEKRINLGNKGLTRLWAMNPDNLGTEYSSAVSEPEPPSQSFYSAGAGAVTSARLRLLKT